MFRSLGLTRGDQGKGIPVNDQKRIFRQFERGENSVTPAGFGLGLYISQQLVEAHGGTIDLVSEAGKGAVFTVCLPLAVPAETAAESAPSSILAGA